MTVVIWRCTNETELNRTTEALSVTQMHWWWTGTVYGSFHPKSSNLKKKKEPFPPSQIVLKMFQLKDILSNKIHAKLLVNNILVIDASNLSSY